MTKFFWAIIAFLVCWGFLSALSTFGEVVREIWGI